MIVPSTSIVPLGKGMKKLEPSEHYVRVKDREPEKHNPPADDVPWPTDAEADSVPF